MLILPSDSLYALLPVVVILCGLILLLLYVLQWRYFPLAQKYAAWQKEAQAIEAATHSALYNLPPSKAHVYPFVTIVVPARNQSDALKQLLPCLLEQKYSGKFEVLVADQLSNDDTQDYLKQLGMKYGNLRSTFVPSTSRYIELRKLAISLGIKAAHSEWVIVVEPDTIPVSDTWLQNFAQNLQPGVDMVEAYYNYEDNGTWKARRAILERVYAYIVRLKSFDGGRVTGCERSNYALRRNWFLEQRGFAESLGLPFGEESIFAFHHAQTDHYVMLCSSETKLRENLPAAKTLSERRVEDAEVIHHLRGMAWQLRWRGFFISVLFHLFMILSVGYPLIRLWHDVPQQQYSMNYLYTDIACLVFWLLLFVLPAYLLRKSLRALGERNYGIYLFTYAWLYPWYFVRTALSCRFHRHAFVRKYLGQVERV